MTSATPRSPIALLPPNSRPVWGMRDLLVRHDRHLQWEHPGAPLPPLEIMTWSVVLRALGGLARYQEARGLDLSGGQAIQHVSVIPLIWPTAWCQNWEKRCPWAKPAYGLHPFHVQPYRDLLESDQPSSAYLFDQTTQPIWSAFMQHISTSDWLAVLESSAGHLDGWLVQYEDQLPTVLQDWRALGESWGLSPKHAAVWACTEAVWHDPLPSQTAVLQFILQAIDYKLDAWLDLMGYAFDMTPAEALQLWGPGSVLHSRRVLAPHPLRLNSKGTQWSDIQSVWNDTTWQTMRQKMWALRSARADKLFPSPSSPMTAPERQAATSRWNHLSHEFSHAQEALASISPVSLLIVGPSGQGKSQLAKDLANVACRRAVYPSTDHDNLTVKPGQQAVSSLLWASLGPHGNDRAVWVLDGPSSKGWEEETLAMHRFFDDGPDRSSVIATLEKIDKLDPQLLRRFDKVIVLHDLPTEKRLTLARQLFTDEELALKVARSIRTPHGIRSAAAWCERVNEWSWATVQSHRQSLDQALRGPGEYLEPVAMDRGEALPPWVGYTHLNDVADRLCLAFENPRAYGRLGGKAPRGAVLKGPPGTGKTLFARHLAQRLNIPLFAPSVSAMVEKPERLRDVMCQARQMAPCVLLLDEAGPLVTLFGRGTEALLSEIEGADPLEGVLILATLNGGILSPAITRPGRLHEVHEVGLPEAGERESIWKAYLDTLPVVPLTENDWTILARASRGFSGAEIAECVRRSGSDAVAAGEDELSLARLVAACDLVDWSAPTGGTGGHAQEQHKTAVHEAGHALLAWRHGMEVHRITVRPRADALGMVALGRDEQQFSLTKSECYGEIQMSLGGIAAEEVVFGEYSNGGSSDLVSVHAHLKRALTGWGFGHLGQVAAGDDFTWSNRRRERLEEEIGLWSREAFFDARTWLKKNQALLEDLAHVLLEERDLSGAPLEEWRARIELLSSPATKPPCYIPSVGGENPVHIFAEDHPSLEPQPHPTVHRQQEEKAPSSADSVGE